MLRAAYLDLGNSNAYRQRHVSKLLSMIGISNRYSTSARVCITNSLHLKDSNHISSSE